MRRSSKSLIASAAALALLAGGLAVSGPASAAPVPSAHTASPASQGSPVLLDSKDLGGGVLQDIFQAPDGSILILEVNTSSGLVVTYRDGVELQRTTLERIQQQVVGEHRSDLQDRRRRPNCGMLMVIQGVNAGIWGAASFFAPGAPAAWLGAW